MRPTSHFLRRSSDKAAALIIVLAFVVILTGLGVAYLSVATTDRQLAHASFHDTAADLLARSALDIVIGDFKQEIVNGSTKSPAPSISRRITVPVPQQSWFRSGAAKSHWRAEPYSTQRSSASIPEPRSAEPRLGR